MPIYTGAAQTMQGYMWQADMQLQSVVLCVGDCLSVLLDASYDTAADADSGATYD